MYIYVCLCYGAELEAVSSPTVPFSEAKHLLFFLLIRPSVFSHLTAVKTTPSPCENIYLMVRWVEGEGSTDYIICAVGLN